MGQPVRKSKLWTKEEEKFAKYEDRYTLRKMQLFVATQNLVGFYENAGDTREQAEIKVTLISREITRLNGGAKLDYFLGDTGQLIDVINLIDQVQFAHFTNEAKAQLIGDLQPTQ